MKTYLYFDRTGRPTLAAHIAHDIAVDGLQSENNYLVIEQEEIISDHVLLTEYWVRDGELINIGKRPTNNSVFSTIEYKWIFQIDLAKTEKWTQIKQARSQAEYAGFTWDGSTFDSNAISQQRINIAVTLALIAKQAAQPYTVIWTLKDNTLRALSADDMIAVGLALGNHVQTVFNKGQQLQQQIEQATTKEEIEAITWQI